MKIYLRLENGKRFFIPAPIWLVKAAVGMGGFGLRIARKYAPQEQMVYFENIDFAEMKRAVNILKKHKGLNMVDVKTRDGTEVKIVI
ncbi:MAG TPA: hypothetical protein PKA19_15010 [Bacillota bacterium]|nr:hypothetical protein [Bacillota bacterium]